MKSLIIYYSLDGNVKLLSETMAQEIGADLLPLHPKKEIKSDTFMKYFWGGRRVVMKSTPELEALSLNPNDYDLIIIGTPVWMADYNPAIRSFLENNSLANKKLAIFYRELMISEANHYTTFLRFAKKYSEKVNVDKRWNEWLEFEGELITNYGKKETVHG